MNTLKTLFFLSLLTFCPSLEAMRPHKALSLASRALQRPFSGKAYSLNTHFQAKNHVLLKEQYRSEREHSDEQCKDEEQTSSHFQYNLIPSIAATAVSLALAQQQSLAEKEKRVSIDTINIYSKQAVFDVLENGTEEQKKMLAERIAQKITTYNVKDIIILLGKMQYHAHSILVTALAENIQSFTLEHLADILANDRHDETHILLAKAFNAHYKHFMVITHGRTFNIHERLNSNVINQYTKFIISLKEEYRHYAAANLVYMLGIKGERKINGSDFFALLSKQQPDMQRLIVILFFAQNYDFNRGEMEKAMCAFIDAQRQLVFNEISKEWDISDSEWNTIKALFDQRKKEFIKATSQADQFEYKIDVPEHIKEAIAIICQKRGVQGKVVITKLPDNSNAYAASTYQYLGNDQWMHKLELNLFQLAHSEKNKLYHVLEHEIGGHIRKNHPSFSHALAGYIILRDYSTVLKNAEVTEILEEIRASTSWQKLIKIEEYEADLLSAIDDTAVAQSTKMFLERLLTESSDFKAPYMTKQEFFQAIMAILYCKEAAQKWFDSNEAYALYGPPAYDAFDYSQSKS